MNLLKKKVLLLNNTYEPLAILPAKKVLKKLLKGSNSFYVEDYYDLLFQSGKHKIQIPSVVRLTYYLNVKKTIKSATGKKHKIFARDGWVCVYCTKAYTPDELTLDHVIPKSKGGDSSSSNLVTACRECNNKKSDRTDHEFGFTISKALLKSNINLAVLISTARKNPQWRKYIYN